MKHRLIFVWMLILTQASLMGQVTDSLDVTGVAGLRVNPFVVYDGESPEAKAGFALHLEAGIVVDQGKLYTACGFTPAANRLYSFNTYRLTKTEAWVPTSLVLTGGIDFDNGQASAAGGLSVAFNNGMAVGNFMLTTDGSFVIAGVVPLNVPWMKRTYARKR